MESGARIAVLYATREGQTQRIAEHVAERLRGRGARVDIDDIAYVSLDAPLRRYRAVILAAPVHLAKHEQEMVDFVKDHRADLEAVHTVFLSVSLSEAGAEMTTAPAARRTQSAEDVRRVIAEFCEETGWHPTEIKPVAGALRYSQYGFIVRFFMRSIARKMGGATDTSRDVEYTDWDSLDAFTDHLVEELEAEANARQASLLAAESA